MNRNQDSRHHASMRNSLRSCLHLYADPQPECGAGRHFFSTGPALPPIIVEDVIDEEEIAEADTIEEPILERTKVCLHLFLSQNSHATDKTCLISLLERHLTADR